MKRHEWRVLPLLRMLPDRIGEQTLFWALILLSGLLGAIYLVGLFGFGMV